MYLEPIGASSTWFYCLHQKRQIRWSLNTNFTVTGVHASLVDHWTPCWLGRSSTLPTDVSMLKAAARIIAETQKFDRDFFSPLSLLCWLDILHCVQYKLRVAIYRCLWNQAPHYQMDCAYISVISVCDQPTNNQLVWPHYCHRKFGSCIFHRLPDEMELCLMRSIDSFTIALKTRSFAVHWH